MMMRVIAKQDLFNLGQKQSGGNGDLIGIELHVVSMMLGWQLAQWHSHTSHTL
jgi:hypothetical protein